MSEEPQQDAEDSPSGMRAPDRDTILLSHANPEDNEFTRWLALQLAAHGYRVWCDLTKLLGGEIFWDDIEAVLRDRTAKVVYVLSRVSNEKDGPLKELHLAQSIARLERIRDFVIPVHIDDLPYNEITIELTRVNAISFECSWAKGLAVLLQKLQDDRVRTHHDFNRTAVNDWWRAQYGPGQGILNQAELLISNWYRVESLPSILYEHRVRGHRPGVLDFDRDQLPYPGIWLSDLDLLTFAPASELRDYLGSKYFVADSRDIDLQGFIAGEDALTAGPKYIAQLLRMAWDRYVQARLCQYETAGGRLCYYFAKGDTPNDTVFFSAPTGRRGHRSVVGYKTMSGGRLRYWHYGISCKPIVRPEMLFLVKGHVLFSDDGRTLWRSKDAMARARRNQCRNWWNDEWRDRLFAAMSHLATPSQSLTLPLGATARLTLSENPVLFESPVSYPDPGTVDKDEDLHDLDDEDDDIDEDEGDHTGAQAG